MKQMDQFNSNDEALARLLEATAQQVDASPSFKAELEKKLMSSHKPKPEIGSFWLKTFVPVLSWTVGLIMVALLFNWVIRSIAPQPQPAIDNTPFPYIQTLIPNKTISPLQGKSYDWNGTKLYLNAPLPDAPIEANVYLTQPDQSATIESARALASRFGIEGQVYSLPGELPKTIYYMITAGGPRIYVRSDNSFLYYKNYGDTFVGDKNLTDEQASAAIDAFLKSHGFDFEYQLEHAPQVYGDYYVVPLLDGRPLRYDYMIPARLQIVLDDNGLVLSVFGPLLNADKVGTYGIRSAEEAFQQIINNAQVGVEQSVRSGGKSDQRIWARHYVHNEPITIYGDVHVFTAAEAGQQPLITLNDYTLTGNTAGLETAQDGVIIKAGGQFVNENETLVFMVDSWEYSSAKNISLMGYLRKEGDQTILVADDGKEYTLTDAPADAILSSQPPTGQLNVSGVVVQDRLEWTMIQYFPAGGRGNSGFYKLNLSGIPARFPTPTPSDQPYFAGDPSLPTATIEIVELAYYIRDSRSEIRNPISESYIQPIWRFYGHYNNGDEFEILIQALKEEYLLPEIAPYTPPG